MNGPPSPTTLTAMCSHRLEQNLTCLALGVSGAVLLSVRSEAQKAIRLRRQANYSRFEVKNVRNSFCTPVFSKSFTLVRCNCLKETPMENSASKSDDEKITETGGRGRAPLLTAFSRPNQSGVAPARHAGSVTVFWPRAGIGECKA